MSTDLIGGVLQIGIGVKNMPISRKWYADNLGFNAIALEEESVTHLMKVYTGDTSHERQAWVIMNMAGAGGLEVWQYLSRKPQFSQWPISLGDLGIFASIIGSPSPEVLYNSLQDVRWKSKYFKEEKTFLFCDPFGNYFQVKWQELLGKKLNNGVIGAIVDCSDLNRSIAFYENILGYQQISQHEKNPLAIFDGVNGSSHRLESALLKKPKGTIGGFSNFLGGSMIHLVQAKDLQPKKIYEGRFWGDPGFIHVCFDVTDMDQLKLHCERHGHSFTVDSFETENGKSFEMGKVMSRVAYIEDPDGTAIEFVETHKLPIIAGFTINFKKNGQRKNVPHWVLQLLSLRKVK